MLMTANPAIAVEAVRAGVDRVFVDLEITGKAERQVGRPTIISGHTLADVRAVREAVPDADLLVRIDPPGPHLARQVDDVIAAGADVVMLPFFTDADQVAEFVAAVGGRATTTLLLETAAALVRLDPILAVDGVDEVHVGLNDLHRSLGLSFMYETLASGLLDHIAARVHACRKPLGFGFGGGALLDAKHPVAPADVLKEHARLGSTMIILSRTFTGDVQDVAALRQRMDLAREISRIREVIKQARARGPDEVERDRRRIHAAIWRVAVAVRADA